MIKELGTIGLFVKFNQSASAPTNLIQVYSSSAVNELLFTASTTSSRSISIPPTASYFVNGTSSGVIDDNSWQHITITLNPKLQTDDSNNFLVRIGQSTSSDFQVQNIYLLGEQIGPIEVLSIHNAFTGASAIIATGESASASILLSDKNESRHSSSVTFNVYQPYKDQLRFVADARLISEVSLSSYIGSPAVKLNGDSRFFDGILSIESDLILSIVDNQLYRLNSSGGVDIVSTSNGDYVNILSGLEYAGSVWLKSSGVFSKTSALTKIDYLKVRSGQ